MPTFPVRDCPETVSPSACWPGINDALETVIGTYGALATTVNSELQSASNVYAQCCKKLRSTLMKQFKLIKGELAIVVAALELALAGNVGEIVNTAQRSQTAIESAGAFSQGPGSGAEQVPFNPALAGDGPEPEDEPEAKTVNVSPGQRVTIPLGAAGPINVTIVLNINIVPSRGAQGLVTSGTAPALSLESGPPTDLTLADLPGGRGAGGDDVSIGAKLSFADDSTYAPEPVIQDDDE